MFDKHSRENFIGNLPENVKSILDGLEGREPWVVDNTEGVDALLEEVGASLKLHSNKERLKELPLNELTMLFYGLSLSRYLTSLNTLSAYPQYMNSIVQPAHNQIDPSDLDVSQQQRVLLSRLNTLVRYGVIERTFSKERRNKIKQILQLEDY